MLSLPFPLLYLSKSLYHLYVILYCGYGHSDVGSARLSKQCLGYKLHFKNDVPDEQH